MILLPYSRPWEQQPQGAQRINWDNPVTRGLQVLVCPASRAELVCGRSDLTFGGDASIAARPRGCAFYQVYAGVSKDITVPATISASGNRTLAVCGANKGALVNLLNVAKIEDGDSLDAISVGSSSMVGYLDNNPGSTISIAESDQPRVFAGIRIGNQVHSQVGANRDSGSITGQRGLTASSVMIGRGVGASTQTFTTYWLAYWNRDLSVDELRGLDENPWQLYEPQRIWVPVSAGGAITIDGNVGNATAAGTAGQVGVAITVNAATGNSTAAGATAQVGVSIDITSSVGNAAAAGCIGQPGVSLDIDATTGNAVAAGTTGVVDLGSNISIAGNVGAAVAAGMQGLPGVAITVDSTTGNAVAAGVTGSVSVSNDITINATAGNAAASGILAGLSLDIDVAGIVGSATAAGVTGAISLSGSGTGATAAEIWSYTLSNGLTAEETVVQTHSMLTALTAAMATCPADLALALKLLRNKQITNQATGKMTVYDDDGSTVLVEGNLFEDAAGTTAYRGQGAERRERLA